MKRFSVICLQCGLSVHRCIDAETAQTEIHPVTYQQKCKIAPDAVDFDCPELERAVERSRRWDPIFQGGMSRPASSGDALVFPEALSEAAVKNQRARSPEKAEQSAEAAALRARVEATDMGDAAPTPFDEGSTLDELRRALHSGDQQQVPAAERVERQIAVIVVVAVETGGVGSRPRPQISSPIPSVDIPHAQ